MECITMKRAYINALFLSENLAVVLSGIIYWMQTREWIYPLLDCKYNNKVVGVSGIRTWLSESAEAVFTARG